MTFGKEPSATGLAIRTAVILVLFVSVFTAALAILHSLTEPAIRASAAEEEMRAINDALPRELYDSDLLADKIELPPTADLGQDQPSVAYRAHRGGLPAALVLKAIAPDGYSGKIHMLVAVRVDAGHVGELAGVRVTEHKETPGLGDYIDPKKDKNKAHPWIDQFDGQSFAKLPEKTWKVKKDGGQFDSIAGATVSPRAVVKAVKKALAWADANQERLFAATDKKGGQR